jgi:hypothetical protein
MVQREKYISYDTKCAKSQSLSAFAMVGLYALRDIIADI